MQRVAVQNQKHLDFAAAHGLDQRLHLLEARRALGGSENRIRNAGGDAQTPLVSPHQEIQSHDGADGRPSIRGTSQPTPGDGQRRLSPTDGAGQRDQGLERKAQIAGEPAGVDIGEVGVDGARAVR